MNVIEINTRDNITLRGTFYYCKKKCLTVLSCSPYRNFENTEYFESFGKFLSNIPAHYIYIDVRGTGESEGYAENEYSLNEMNDTIDIIKYIRSQKWSNGSVMMHGISYSAFNALQACSHSDGPDCLFLMHVSNDRWLNDIHYLGGVKTITEDINYSFATTGQNLLPCLRCVNTNIKKIKTPWYMKWFKKGCQSDTFWKNGLINKLPPTFIICGWRDTYSYTAVHLSHLVSFTLIGPFGHKYPHDHDEMVKKWIKDIFKNGLITLFDKYNKIKNYTGKICIVIPTPRSLWKYGYYQIKSYINPEYFTVFKSNETITLKPDLVGDTLEVYVTGDPVITPSLKSVRKDLTRLDWGCEYEIIINNYGVWGEPQLIIHCLKFEKGDYIVARLVTEQGETLSVGVSRLNNDQVIIKLRPFFIPVNSYKMYLFLNRSWVPVLYPTTNMKNIKLNSVELLLPLIKIDHYIKLNSYPNTSEIELLDDVKIKKKSENNKLEYNTINEYPDKSFREKLFLSFNLGKTTRVNVENIYSIDNYNIKTTTEIKNKKTDVFDVNITAYNNDTLISNWKDSFVIGNCN